MVTKRDKEEDLVGGHHAITGAFWRMLLSLPEQGQGGATGTRAMRTRSGTPALLCGHR